MESIHEVFFLGWLLDVLYLLQILVYVFGINIGYIKFIKES